MEKLILKKYFILLILITPLYLFCVAEWYSGKIIDFPDSAHVILEDDQEKKYWIGVP